MVPNEITDAIPDEITDAIPDDSTDEAGATMHGRNYVHNHNDGGNTLCAK
jgi:hypothetical protein